MNSAMHGGTETVTHSVARVRRDVHELADAVETTATELQGYLRSELTQRPYLTLALAAGAGYILGGGLPSRMTGLMLTFGSRIAVALLAREVTARLAPDVTTSPILQTHKGDLS